LVAVLVRCLTKPTDVLVDISARHNVSVESLHDFLMLVAENTIKNIQHLQ
jgi:hypothetical protein